MLLLEVRDLRTNDLIASYDVTGEDLGGTVRAIATDMPETACLITVERDNPLGDLTPTPAAVPEPAPTPAAAPTVDPDPAATDPGTVGTA